MKRFWVHFEGEKYEYMIEANNEEEAIATCNTGETEGVVHAVPIHALLKDVSYCYSADPLKSNIKLFSEVSPLG